MKLKMDKIEKIIVAIAAISIIIVCCILFDSFKQIEKAGGIRAVIVDMGKEVKSIYKEIEE